MSLNTPVSFNKLAELAEQDPAQLTEEQRFSLAKMMPLTEDFLARLGSLALTEEHRAELALGFLQKTVSGPETLNHFALSSQTRLCIAKKLVELSFLDQTRLSPDWLSHFRLSDQERSELGQHYLALAMQSPAVNPRVSLEQFELPEAVVTQFIAQLLMKGDLDLGFGYLEQSGLSMQQQKSLCAGFMEGRFELMDRLPAYLRPSHRMFILKDDTPSFRSSDQFVRNAVLAQQTWYIHASPEEQKLASQRVCNAADFWELTLTEEQCQWIYRRNFLQLMSLVGQAGEPLWDSFVYTIADMAKDAPPQTTWMPDPKGIHIENLLDPVLFRLAGQGVELAEIQRALSQQHTGFQDMRNFLSLFEALGLLAESEHLDTRQKTRMIEELCNNPSEMFEKTSELSMIFCLKQDALLQIPEDEALSLEVQVKRAVQAHFAVNSELQWDRLPLSLRPCYNLLFGSPEQAAASERRLPPQVLRRVAAYVQKKTQELEKKQDGAARLEQEKGLLVSLIDVWYATLSAEQLIWACELPFLEEITSVHSTGVFESMRLSVVDVASHIPTFQALQRPKPAAWTSVFKLPLTLLWEYDRANDPGQWSLVDFATLVHKIDLQVAAFKNDKLCESFYDTLDLLANHPEFSRTERLEVLREVCRQPGQFVQNMIDLRIVLDCGREDLLRQEGAAALNLRAASNAALAELLPELDLRVYASQFGPHRDPEAMRVYAGRIASLKDPAATASLRAHIASVLDGSYQAKRYSLEGNPHLAAIDEETLTKWRQNVAVPLTNLVDIEDPSSSKNLRRWLSQVLIDEKALGNLDEYPFIRDLLLGKSGALDVLKEKVQNIQSLAPEERRAVSLQHKLSQLLVPSSKLSPLALLQELRSGGLFPGKGAFKERILAKISEIEEISPLMRYTVHSTDDFRDFLFLGKEPQVTCQQFDGAAILNRGLLGYWHHGQTRLVAVKDETGRIVMRSIVRLLLDGSRPALYIERVYHPQEQKPHCLTALQNMLQWISETLVIPTMSSIIEGEPNNFPDLSLECLGGFAPEYVDGAGGICPEGKFTLSHLKYTFPNGLR